MTFYSLGNIVGLLSLVEIWLCTQFQMKDVGEVQCILGIKALKDHMNRKIMLSQATYIDKLIFKYVMWDSKKGQLPFKHAMSRLKISIPKHMRRKIK